MLSIGAVVYFIDQAGNRSFQTGTVLAYAGLGHVIKWKGIGVTARTYRLNELEEAF